MTANSRRRAWMCAAVVAAALAETPGRVQAQERPGGVYASGGIAFPYQKGVTGEQFEIYTTAPGGTTGGWTLAAGVFVTRVVSVEGEFAGTGMMRAREPSRYNEIFNEERRDYFLGGNVRFHVRAASSVDVEPVAGLAFARHRAWSQIDYTPLPGLPPRESGPRISRPLPTSLGLSTGLDVRLGGAHVAFVPSFRLRYRFAILADNASFDWYPGGFPRWTISPAFNVRVDF